MILASGDQTAIDAVAAKMMGFDPLSIPYIRLAHEAGLGVGDPREIELADVFDIDLYVDGQVSGNDHTVNRAAVRAIHERGAHAVCYVSAGTAERFRPDYHEYVRFNRHHGHSLIGKPFSRRFPNEYWLNLKNGRGQRDFILRRVEARTRKCARARFDGIEYDVVDAYSQGREVTGWRITARHQLIFNRALARIAHRHGLSVALKNDLGQVP